MGYLGYVGGMVYDMGKTPYPDMLVWYCWRYGTGKIQHVVWYVYGMVRWYGAVGIFYG